MRNFSLVRKVLLEDAGLNLDETYAPFERPLGEELLEPTKIYVKPVLEAVKSGKIAGMAHVRTGGENQIDYETGKRRAADDFRGLRCQIDRFQA